MITPVTEIDKETQEVIDQKKKENKILFEKYNKMGKTK